MKIILTVEDKGMTFTYHFPSISLAYRFYLAAFSSKDEWDYYQEHAHRSLDEVDDEEVMLSIFRHVFCGRACLTIKSEKSVAIEHNS